MFIRLWILASLLVSGAVQAVEVASPLEQDRGKFRPLVIFARSTADPTLQAITKELADPATKQAFTERDMVLYTIVNIDGKRDDKGLEPQSTMSLLRGLKPGMIRDKAKVILIGKDGEKKVEQEGDVDLKELFKIVDAMPMAEKESQAKVDVVTPEKKPPASKAGKSAKPAKEPVPLSD